MAFDGDWFYYEPAPNEDAWSCLKQSDVVKLRELLIQCRREL